VGSRLWQSLQFPRAGSTLPLSLNEESKALDPLDRERNQIVFFCTVSLVGGKTETLSACRSREVVFARQNRVLRLVPEISLTPQTIRRFGRAV